MSIIPDGTCRSLAALPASEFLRRWDTLPPEDQADAMRGRFRYDRGSFLKFTLPALFGRPWNRYHADVLGRDSAPWVSRTGRNTYRCDAAPRGIAKTTLLKGELVHDVCYGLENYIVVVSAETRLARAITRHLFRVFRSADSKLARLFGPFVVDGGVDSFAVTTPDGHRTGFLARSFGTQIRGANEDGDRPTKIVIDDGERPDRVRNPDQRVIWMDFLQSDILNAGPIEGGLVVDWRGTVLHPDSTLANLLKNVGWSGVLYRACEAWPTNTALWEECRRIYVDLSIGTEAERWTAAHEFYGANRAEMDAGAKMLDDAALPLFAFYVEIWTKGIGYVLRERQNDPRDPSRSFFRPEAFARCQVEPTAIVSAAGKRIALTELEVAVWHDRSKGGATNDYPATAVVARDAQGYRYVLSVEMTREPTSAQRARVWRTWERWRAAKRIVVGCDDTAQTEVFAGESWQRDRDTRQKAGIAWNLDIRSVTLDENKEVRIASIEPDCVNGWLQFSSGLPPSVWEQFRDFPTAAYDDAPDAIERANWLLTDSTPMVSSRARG